MKRQPVAEPTFPQPGPRACCSLWIVCTASMLFAASIILTSSPANAQTAVELRGGYYSDVEEGFVGGGFLTDLGNAWDFNPNVEWVLVDGYDYLTVNGDLHYDFTSGRGSGAALWAGAGMAWVHTALDNRPPGADRTNDDVGVNLFTGIGARSGSVRPFMQLKGRIADDNETSFALGLRF